MWRFLFRPLLFLLDPEKAHHLTLHILRWVCVIPGVKNWIKWMYAPRHAQRSIQLFGLSFKNPVGLAAGLDKDGKFIGELALCGFSHIEIGTVTPKPQAGNSQPRLFRLTKDEALINRMGFNNEGVEAMVGRLKKLNKPNDLVLGINIGKNKDTPNEKAIVDYLYCFNSLYPYADYFTINISSPNTPGLRGLQEKEPLTRLLEGMSEANNKKPRPKPILVKLAPDLDDHQLAESKQIILDFKLDGIIMGNTTLDRAGLMTGADRLDKIGTGGLSGLPLMHKSTQRLLALKKLPGELPVIGVGGIMNESMALAKLQTGADLIQIYTGFVYHGPGLVKSICNQIGNAKAV